MKRKLLLFIPRRLSACLMMTLLVLALTGTQGMAATIENDEEKTAANSADMVVTATKIEQSSMDVPFLTSSVTREEIEKMGAKNLNEALRSIPGLQIGVQGNAYPHLEVRGFRDTKDLAVLIDGVPFRQLNGSADLTMIPLSISKGLCHVEPGRFHHRRVSGPDGSRCRQRHVQPGPSL
jgi:outer membrane cobalamin receptor